LLVIAADVGAHHAFSPVYDERRTVTIQGVVTEFKFVSPHALLSVDVSGDTGRVVTWTVEFAGRHNLSEVGWTEKSIVPGERVTVSGNPTHTNSPRLFFRRIVKDDGTELLPAGPQRDRELDELRRQRRAGQQQK
jgi:hypothetical protein